MGVPAAPVFVDVNEWRNTMNKFKALPGEDMYTIGVMVMSTDSDRIVKILSRHICLKGVRLAVSMSVTGKAFFEMVQYEGRKA